MSHAPTNEYICRKNTSALSVLQVCIVVECRLLFAVVCRKCSLGHVEEWYSTYSRGCSISSGFSGVLRRGGRVCDWWKSLGGSLRVSRKAKIVGCGISHTWPFQTRHFGGEVFDVWAISQIQQVVFSSALSQRNFSAEVSSGLSQMGTLPAVIDDTHEEFPQHRAVRDIGSGIVEKTRIYKPFFVASLKDR